MTRSTACNSTVDLDELGKSSVPGCINHPRRETNLRCNRCNNPICPECARKTPVGYRCTECVRQQQSIFDTAVWHDYVVVAVISFVLSGLAGALLVRLGWFVIFLAPTVGGIISEIIRRSVGRRRGKYLSYVAVGCMLLAVIFNLTMWGIVYLFIAATTVYTRLRSFSI